MPALRKLKYLGRKPLPIKLEMPWLSDPPPVIDEHGICVCLTMDAKELLLVNPGMFADLGDVETQDKQPKSTVPPKSAKKKKG